MKQKLLWAIKNSTTEMLLVDYCQAGVSKDSGASICPIIFTRREEARRYCKVRNERAKGTIYNKDKYAVVKFALIQ